MAMTTCPATVAGTGAPGICVLLFGTILLAPSGTHRPGAPLLL